MPAFIRYPFFGCVILALSACGSSGSSRLLEPTAPPTDSTPTLPSASYPGVDYLIMDVSAAREKYGTETTNDDDTTTTTPAPLPSRLTSARDLIVARTNRYLSTGGVLMQTDQGSVTREAITATCADETATDAAQCVFSPDNLRMEMTTFSFGLKNPDGVSFASDREPVMSYRGVDLSQVRATEASKFVYQDGSGNEYLLTSTNVIGMNVDDVALPSGVTTLPDFADLRAVYEDTDGNEYLLTPDNVAGMNLDDVTPPDGVTTLPEFTSLSRVTRASDSEYVGYDGILQHSMFFVGIDRFLDEDGDVMHLRFGHASLGWIYDDDTSMPGVQMPTVSLTGEGVMVGVESRKNSLEHYLVQGDVNIMYDPSVTEDNTANPPVVGMPAMIDISIDNIQRLNDDGNSWYANPPSEVLNWNVPVMDSEFLYNDITQPTALGPGDLRGSLYGTEDNPEVGGVFHHEGMHHEIVGSFGSRLNEPDPEDDN